VRRRNARFGDTRALNNELDSEVNKNQSLALPADNWRLAPATSPVANNWPPTLAASAWIVWAIALAALILRHTAGGVHRVYAFNDYTLAGWHWMHSEYLYGNWRGFIYSPTVAVFFVPFAVLPSFIAYILWLLLNVSVFLYGVGALLESKIIPGLERNAPALIYLLLLPCALGNLDVGQANPFVVGLLMLAIVAVYRERWNSAALCVALATYFKIYPLAVGMLICVIAPRRFTWRLLVALLVLAAVPFLFQHGVYVTEQYRAWITTRAADNRMNYSMKHAPIDLWFLLHTIAHLPIPTWFYTGLQFGTGGLIALFGIWGLRKGWTIRRLLCGLFFLVSIWMTLCGPATEAHTYLLMAPALVMALVKSFHDRQPILLRLVISGAFFFQVVHTTRINYLLHNKHDWVFIPLPLSALLFLVYCLIWLLNDLFWKRIQNSGVRIQNPEFTNQ
jgi:Glycosyltransferase family 87